MFKGEQFCVVNLTSFKIFLKIGILYENVTVNS